MVSKFVSSECLCVLFHCVKACYFEHQSVLYLGANVCYFLVFNCVILLSSGETKSTLLLLQEAVKEGNKCDQQAKRLLTSIGTMCKNLKPLNGFASKFETVVKLLKLVHKNLDKLTKFADNIPRIGQLRKIIVEKVIPMALDALEVVEKAIWKVIDYEKRILKYEKTAKLLWKIDKQGKYVFS